MWCHWFSVNMGISDQHRILIENLYVFKGHGAKNLLGISE